VRQAVLEGLRDSSREGTAAGIGHRGLWAKTGTVAAVDGAPLATSGWALAVDDSGWSILGLLPRGTGHEAARALAEPLARWRPWSLTARDPGEVRLALFEALAPRAVVARNLGDAPTAGSRGYVGPGASLALRPGDRLEAGRWELAIPARGLLRRIQGAVECSTARDGALRLTAELPRREYVAGVLLAELPMGDAERRRELGAAVLRFLAGGPRHGAVDVCDTTHCAWFVGRGPRVRWVTGGRVALLAEPAPPAAQPEAFDDGTWAEILSRAAQPGPMQWTAHCGGQPLSARFVWGHGEGRAAACPRHRGGHDAPWLRRWSARDVARAFGAAVPSLAVTEVDGVWTLRAGPRHYRYDEAHRLLSSVLGWDALPSPASQIRAVAGGFEAQGVGSGHRVGLCLAD
jgi:hypothetical protein